MVELNRDVFNHESGLAQNLFIILRLCEKQTFELYLIIFWSLKLLFIRVYQIKVAFLLWLL